MKTKPKKKIWRPYWIRTYVGSCPVCGREAGYKERVYGPKPKKIENRYVQLPDTATYDHCLEWGSL